MRVLLRATTSCDERSVAAAAQRAELFTRTARRGKVRAKVPRLIDIYICLLFI